MPIHGTSQSDAGAVGQPVCVLIPLFNDWGSLTLLLRRLDGVLVDSGRVGVGVLVVDDGSTQPPPREVEGPAYRALGPVEVLSLRRNLGHQRAIAVGLAYASERGTCDYLVVMDGDGEDDPADVPRLLVAAAESPHRPIVFAERTRRSESIRFRVFYAIYRLIHSLLTGRGVKVGNFSVIPRRRLDSLAVVSELWSHYAAAAIRSRQPVRRIPTQRARRLAGRSSMNFVNLVTHGLSAISVYSDLVGVRLLVAVSLLGLLDLVGLGTIAAWRIATGSPVPMWVSYGVGLLTLVMVPLMMLVFVFVFILLGGRPGSAFLPVRDYAYFLGEKTTWPMRGSMEIATGPDPGPSPGQGG
jgi:hypothetical protein